MDGALAGRHTLRFTSGALMAGRRAPVASCGRHGGRAPDVAILLAVDDSRLARWRDDDTPTDDDRVVRVTAWSIEVRDPQDASARAAVQAYSVELDQILGASSPTIVDPDPAAYREPRGTFLVVLHDEARRRGLDRVVLDSKRELFDARRLYLAAGYRDIEPYGDNADATAWMGLRLDGSDWSAGAED